MTTKTKMKHCAWCGDELGMTESWDREPESCAKRECSREVSAMYQQERDERRWAAEEDDYQRY